MVYHISYVRTLCSDSIPSEARHARSVATRFVTADCTYHQLKTAHDTNKILHITQSKSPNVLKPMYNICIYVYIYMWPCAI